MNKNIKLYFDNHPTKDVFFFTLDGQAFFDKPAAAAHAQNLEKREKGTGKVVEVSRLEVTEWWAGEAPKLAKAAEAKVVQCEKEVETAQAAVNTLPKTATPTKRMQANNALADAIKAHASATAELVIAAEEAAKFALEENLEEKDEISMPFVDTKTPEQKIAEAQKALDDANQVLADANKAKTELPDTATGPEKTKATKAVNAAAAVVAEAQVALDELTTTA